MELTGAGDDVLTALGLGALDERIGLGQTLETLDQTRQIGGLLGLDGHTHDGTHGVLHGLERVRVLVVGQRTGLGEVLIHTDQSDGVTGRDVVHTLELATHLDAGTLHGALEEILLAAELVVGAENADLLGGGDRAGEDTAESVETRRLSLLGARVGHHLADVHDQRSVRVALGDRLGGLVVLGAGVQDVHAVLLGLHRGGQMLHHHVEQRVGGGQPVLHADLEQILVAATGILAGLLGHGHLELGEDLVHVLVGATHAGVHHSLDGLDDELAETAAELLAVGGGRLLAPLLGGRVVVVLTPETLHERLLGHTKALGVDLGELTEGEAPAVETGGESHGILARVHLPVTETSVLVGGDDDVHGLDGTGQSLVDLLRLGEQLEEHAIELVHGEHRLDALVESLAQHSLGLHTHTLDAVHHHESTVGHTKGGSHLRGEINVTRRIDQVDEEIAAVAGLGDDLVFGHGESQRDTGGLDGDGALLLILTGVHLTLGAGVLKLEDTSGGQQRVGQRGLAVIDVSNHRHVTDVVTVVHVSAKLFNGLAYHDEKIPKKN
mmetsp:Transcript_13823/g.41648  ORF Transcript_13823/g.41648 Transcript_13823/m.41648 type:complete len:552 (+) Transcript_13823:1039-2694(+)